MWSADCRCAIDPDIMLERDRSVWLWHTCGVRGESERAGTDDALPHVKWAGTTHLMPTHRAPAHMDLWRESHGDEKERTQTGGIID